MAPFLLLHRHHKKLAWLTTCANSNQSANHDAAPNKSLILVQPRASNYFLSRANHARAGLIFFSMNFCSMLALGQREGRVFVWCVCIVNIELSIQLCESLALSWATQQHAMSNYLHMFFPCVYVFLTNRPRSAVLTSLYLQGYVRRVRTFIHVYAPRGRPGLDANHYKFSFWHITKFFYDITNLRIKVRITNFQTLFSFVQGNNHIMNNSQINIWSP